jgi:hypothetical protein
MPTSYSFVVVVVVLVVSDVKRFTERPAALAARRPVVLVLKSCIVLARWRWWWLLLLEIQGTTRIPCGRTETIRKPASAKIFPDLAGMWGIAVLLGCVEFA